MEDLNIDLGCSSRKFISKGAETFRCHLISHLQSSNLDKSNSLHTENDELFKFNIQSSKRGAARKKISTNRPDDRNHYMFNEKLMGIKLLLNRILTAKSFRYISLFLLTCDSISIALQTDLHLRKTYSIWLSFFQCLFLIIFTTEVLFKITLDVRQFFKSAWNMFDLSNLVVSILIEIFTPDGSSVKNVKIFRNLKLISHFIELRIIIVCVGKAIRSVILISALIFALGYLFARIGNLLYGDNNQRDDGYFTTTEESLITLFAIMTLDQWWRIFNLTYDEHGKSRYHYTTLVYFVSWILLASFIFQNLFTGVMVNNFQQIRSQIMRKLQANKLNKCSRKLTCCSRADSADKDSNPMDDETKSDDIISENNRWVKLVQEAFGPLKHLERNSVWTERNLLTYYQLMQIVMENVKEKITLVDLASQSLIFMHDCANRIEPRQLYEKFK